MIDLDILAGGQRASTEQADGLVHGEAFRRVLELLSIKSVVESTPDRDRGARTAPGVIVNRRHDAILVSARRGDGKTTFLLDVQKSIGEDGRGYVRYLPETLRSNAAALWCLGLIDPTLVETKQNIVVMVIDRVRRAVDSEFERQGSHRRGEYNDLKGTLHALADGLTLLDGIGDDAHYGRDWADSDYVLERGLDRAGAAARFEEAFQNYLAQACDYLKRDAFLLLLDDVDTSFGKGWPVLEAIRKYFATPRLKIVLAGDLKLYSILVRRQQWDQIGRNFVDIEKSMPSTASYSDQLAKMVDVLQDQYLVKIAQPRNRVDLRPLIHYLESDIAIRFKSSSGQDGRTPTAADFVRRLVERVFILRGRDVAPIRSLLLRLPLRSTLQIVRGAWAFASDEAIAGKASDAREEAIEAIRHVASAQLMTLDLDENDLRDPDPSRIFGQLSGWMTHKQLWRSMTRFHPQGIDDAHDLVSLVVAATLIRLFERTPRAMIDYWIQICTLREMVDRGQVSIEPSADRRRAQIDLLLAHLQATTNERSMQFASRLAAWDLAEGRQLDRGIRFSGISVPAGRIRGSDAAALELYGKTVSGVKQHFIGRGDKIRLLPLPLRPYHYALTNADWPYDKNRETRAGFSGTYANSLATLRNGLSEPARSIAMLPACIVTSGQQADNGVYSFPRLLSFVGEVMALSDEVSVQADRVATPTAKSEEPDEARQAKLETAITDLLVRYGADRRYPIPRSELAAERNLNSPLTGADDEDDEDASDQESGGNSEGGYSDFGKVMAAWVLSGRRDQKDGVLSPVTLARIWTRFTYACEMIYEDSRPKKTRYLGVVFHRTLVLFLHSVGVECLIADGVATSANWVNNPTGKIDNFLNLLNFMRSNEGTLTGNNVCFFKFIFSCPLWGYFFANRDYQQEDPLPEEDNVYRVKRLYDIESSHFGDAVRHNTVFYSSRHEACDVEFDGLFDLLNTINIQGGRAAAPAGGASTEKKPRAPKVPTADTQ